MDSRPGSSRSDENKPKAPRTSIYGDRLTVPGMERGKGKSLGQRRKIRNRRGGYRRKTTVYENPLETIIAVDEEEENQQESQEKQNNEDSGTRGSEAMDNQIALTSASSVIIKRFLFDNRKRRCGKRVINKKTLKDIIFTYFFRNKLTDFMIDFVNSILQIQACVFYVICVVMDRNSSNVTCDECSLSDKLTIRRIGNNTQEQIPPISDESFNWNALLWVNRPYELWVLQVIIAYISLARSLFMLYRNYNGNLRQQLLSSTFLLEMITTIPFAISVFYPSLRNMFIPVFLNCWLAKTSMRNMFNELNRGKIETYSVFCQKTIVFSVNTFCLVFTTICGIEHLQRASLHPLNLFYSLYYVVTSFSPFGRDYRFPDMWLSQFFVLIMVFIAFLVLPIQFVKVISVWDMRDPFGAEPTFLKDKSQKHVVMCGTHFQLERIMDFLYNIFGNSSFKNLKVILLFPSEPNYTEQILRQAAFWYERVFLIRGSCLEIEDLKRAAVDSAEGCFIMSDGNIGDKNVLDKQIANQSWSVRYFAPKTKQYLHIMRTENKKNVTFVENVVCRDEFKFALLASNCLVRGLSTLVTLLLHPSDGEEGQLSNESWQIFYGGYAENGIYHIRLAASKFFGEFEGKSFTYASFHSHRKFGVALVGVIPASTVEGVKKPLLLNPGPDFILDKMDICIYMSLVKEEDITFVFNSEGYPMLLSMVCSRPDTSGVAERPNIPTFEVEESDSEYDPQAEPFVESIPLRAIRSSEMSPSSRRPNVSPDNVVPMRSKSDGQGNRIRVGYPPIPLHIGVDPILCYLLSNKAPQCCIQLSQACEHYNYRTAYEYKWTRKPIILIADVVSNGIYNFIMTLRARHLALTSLHPIVLMVERIPDPILLDTISYFPFVYWMMGSIDSVDDLLQAGILISHKVVVTNKELPKTDKENARDWKTIVSVYNMMGYFPNVDNLTEISQPSNMRFINFAPFDKYAHRLSEIEKAELERGSLISYMFHLPFSAGKVFNTSILDSLLYQDFAKQHIISFVRSLLGLDQVQGSGFLKSMAITKKEMWIGTYGRLSQILGSSTAEIPFAIYRTEDPPKEGWKGIRVEYTQNEKTERAKMANLVKARMEAMNLPLLDYDAEEHPDKVSYVLINPEYDASLQEGDLIYLIAPSRETYKRESSSKQSTKTTRKQQTSAQSAGSASTRQPPPASNNSEPAGLSQPIRITVNRAFESEVTPPEDEVGSSLV